MRDEKCNEQQSANISLRQHNVSKLAIASMEQIKNIMGSLQSVRTIERTNKQQIY